MNWVILFWIIMPVLQQPSFKETQLKHSRVKTAYEEKEIVVKEYFTEKKLSYQKFQLFIRAFKKGQTLEVWIKETGKEKFELLHTYDFLYDLGNVRPQTERR